MKYTREQLTEVVELVCSEVGISPPKSITFTEDSSGGTYWPDSKRMQLPLSDERVGYQLNCIDVALHEAAHHVTDTVYGQLYYQSKPSKLPKWRQNKRLKRKHHGEEFQVTLHELASLWYGDASLYGWQHEYKSITKIAAKRGWSKTA